MRRASRFPEAFDVRWVPGRELVVFDHLKRDAASV
jgi:hypothetical protein